MQNFIKTILSAIKVKINSINAKIELTKESIQDISERADDAWGLSNDAKSYAMSAKVLAEGAQNTADLAHEIAVRKMEATNPVGTGTFSINRQSDSAIGEYSSAIGQGVIAAASLQNVIGKYNVKDQAYTIVKSSSDVSFRTNSKNSYYYSKTYSFDKINGIFTLINPEIAAGGKDFNFSGYYVIYNNEYSSNEIYLCNTAYSSGNQSSGGTYRNYYAKKHTCTLSISETASYAHIVGNGASDAERSNAHTLDWDGNAWYAGDVYVGSTSGTNMDEGSKRLATEDLVKTKVSFTEPQSLTDEQKAQARENIGVEVDWSENDPNAPGYIKNRTHWVESSDGEILFDEVVTFNDGEYLGNFLSGLEKDKTYKVTFDGIEYTCECKTVTVNGLTLSYIGNLARIQAGLMDTGEPFIMGNDYSVGGFIIIADTPGGSYECGVTIATAGEAVHKIDPKFLPEGIPYIETITTDTITFDGNMDGKLTFSISNGVDTTYFVKVSDGIVDSADVIGGMLSVISLVDTTPSAILDITLGDITDASVVGQKGFVISNSIGVVTEAGMFNGQIVEKGIYFSCVLGAGYISGLKLPKKSIKIDIYHKLDNNLLDLEWIPVSKQDIIIATSVISSPGTNSITGKCDLDNIDEVEVNWDGVSYTCKVIRQDADDAVLLYIGNLSIDNGAAEDNTGEPFFIALVCDLNGNITSAGYLPSDNGIHIFSVRAKKTYEKLPSEFLPESVATDTDVAMLLSRVEEGLAQKSQVQIITWEDED